jgi:hypothetical protein
MVPYKLVLVAHRKDSEQTKRIEELEQQNEELKDERDRLMEELDSVSGVA